MCSTPTHPMIEVLRRSMDRLSFGCLALLVVVPAWVFGGIQARIQTWMLWLALIGVAFGTARLLIPDDGKERDRRLCAIPWLVYALFAAITFGAFQLLPLKYGQLESLSPTAANWWVNWAEFGPDSRLPISTSPSGTRKDMSTLVLILSSVVLASLSVKTPFRRLALCALLAANGAAMSFFGMIQQLTSEVGTIYWNIPLTLGGTPFAGFVNRNNGAGYLNMCLGLSMGFMLWSATRFTMTLSRPTNGRRSRVRTDVRWSEIFASLDSVSIFAAAATVFIAGGVLSTLSRGGAVAMLVAVIAMVLVTARVHRGLIGVGSLVTLTLIGLGLTFWLGRAELLQQRFEILLETESLAESEPRILHWKDAMEAVKDFPIVGTGMGSYRFAYQPYETRGAAAWYVHAENQYVESAVEGGILGFSLLVLCITVAGLSIYGMLRASDNAETYAFAFAAVFVLTSQVVHSCFDFGLYIPSNAVLLAVVCGVAGSSVPSKWKPTARWFYFREKWLSVLIATLVMGASLLAVRELSMVAAFEDMGQEIRREESPDIDATEYLPTKITELQRTLDRRPDDSEAQYRQAKLWSTLYRVRAVQQIRSSLPSLTDSELMNVASLEKLFLQAQDAGKREQLIQQPLIQECLGKAWQHLQLARRGCPEMAKTHLLMARLCPLFDRPEHQATYLDHVLETSPGDPGDLFDVGVLKMYAGDTEAAIALWKRALTNSNAHRQEMIEIGTRYLGTVELYRRLLDGRPDQIVRVARTQYRGDQNQNLRLELVSLAEQQLLADQVSGGPERDYLLGMIAQIREDWPAAVESYDRAVKQSPRNLDWRYLLATSYMRLERPRLSQARIHAQLGQRFASPSDRRFAALLTTIQSRIDARKRSTRPNHVPRRAVD